MGLISDAAISRGDLMRRQAETDHDITEVRTARRAQATSVGAGGTRYHSGGGIDIDDGGGIDINGGGAFQVITEEGEVLVNLGDEVDFGGSTQGWRLNYKSGNRAIALGGSEGHQIWQLWDEAGNYLVTNDGVSGVGLARPYLNYFLVPTTSAESAAPRALWPSTTLTTPIGLLEGYNSVWHPKVAYRVVTITDVGDGVDWSLRFGDEVAVSGTDTSDGVVDTPGWGDTIRPGHVVNVTVEAAVTGAATRAWIQVTALIGCESFDF